MLVSVSVSEPLKEHFGHYERHIESAIYLSALMFLHSVARDAQEQPADTCIYLNAPLSVESALYFRDCYALEISRSDALSRLKLSGRLFTFRKTVLKFLGISPAFFAAEDGSVGTFLRDIIDSVPIPSFLGSAALCDTESVIDVTS